MKAKKKENLQVIKQLVHFGANIQDIAGVDNLDQLTGHESNVPCVGLWYQFLFCLRRGPDAKLGWLAAEHFKICDAIKVHDRNENAKRREFRLAV